MPRADYGDPDGTFQVWTCAVITNHDHEEEVSEVVDPDGCTIAYFHDDTDAEAYCAWRNAARAVPVVHCKFCHQEVPAATAHAHQGMYVGDACCWDERLRTTA